MKRSILNVLVSVLLITLMLPAWAEAPTNPPGTYYTSWMGNTFMDVNGNHRNVTELVSDVCVSPTNGHVFTAGYAETWGGGATFEASDGSAIGRYDRFETGFGDPVSCVAADDNWVYFGTSNKGIMRAVHGGVYFDYTQFLGSANIQGICYKNGKLYVSDFGADRIRVLNASTMAEERSWTCPDPTKLAVDNNGNVWVVIYDTSSIQPPSDGPMWWGYKIKSFSSTGTAGVEITNFEKPIAVAVNGSNQLLVGGLNPHSQLWKYDLNGTSSATHNGAFGANGGIFSGTAGAFTTSAKLHWIKSIFVDSSGNIYTACYYGTFWGGCIEKWTSGGTLIWRDFAATSLDCGGIDPDNETEVYSKYHHYSLDYSKTTPGTEWSLKGFTVNRFKYPSDIRVDQNTDVVSRSLGAGAYRIGGKLFVARSHQEGYECELFRQDTATDGEVLVPSFRLGAGGDANNHFFNATTKTWYDKPKKDNLYNAFGCIAKNGDLFSIADNPDKIIRYPYNGLDANNNPNWDAASATLTPAPEFSDTRRIQYDSDADVLYVGGEVPGENWGTFLKVKAFPNWLAGNRTSSWTVTLPYEDSEYTPNINYGGGQPTAMAIAGNYVFIAYGYGHIRILNKSNGALVGTLVQDVANGWHGSEGQIDATFGLTAFLRSNGEYVILFENAAWANIMMHRWDPGTPPPTTVATPTFSPNGGTFDTTQPVTISCSTSGATIRYTTNGSTPSTTNGTVIASGGTVTLSATTTLKVIAYKSGMNNSSVKSATYTKNVTYLGYLDGGVAAPTSPTNLTTTGTSDWAHWGRGVVGDFNHKSSGGSQISNYTKIGTSGTVTRFTGGTGFIWTDGSPTASQTTSNTAGIYLGATNGGFQITAPASTTERTLKVFVGVSNATGKMEAFISDGSPVYTDNSVTSTSTLYRVYTFTYAAASDGQTITIKWTRTSTTGNVRLKAATLTGGVTPPAQVAAPTLSPASGSVPVTVTITSATSGATILYTTDGSDPATNGYALENGSTVNLTAACTLKAMAYVDGMLDSTTTSGTYSAPSQVATPTMSPTPPASFTTSQAVTLACGTSGASIYYTLDGSTPDSGDTLYTGPFTLTATTTVKAIAMKSGMTNSAVATGTYTKGSSRTTYSFDDFSYDGDPIIGTHSGVNFGTGQWNYTVSWAGLNGCAYFADESQNYRTFTLPAGQALYSIKLSAATGGSTWEVRDSASGNAVKSGTFAAGGSPITVTTGWANPSGTIMITFSDGWNGVIDDITY